MKFFALASVLAAAVAALAAPSANTASLSYDQTYDNASGSLDTVACSDGPNGLEAPGRTTFGALPGFPRIGGAFAVGGWGSAACGTCWEVTYNGKSINILAMDHADAGTFNIALAAMNELTNNQAEFLGRITVSYAQVATSQCQ